MNNIIIQALSIQAFSLHWAACYLAFGVYGLVVPLLFCLFHQLVRRRSSSVMQGFNFFEAVGCDVALPLALSWDEGEDLGW